MAKLQEMTAKVLAERELNRRDDIYTLYVYTVHFVVPGRQIEATRYFIQYGAPLAELKLPDSVRIVKVGRYKKLCSYKAEREAQGYDTLILGKYMLFKSEEEYQKARAAMDKRWSDWRKAILINYALTGGL